MVPDSNSCLIVYPATPEWEGWIYNSYETSRLKRTSWLASLQYTLYFANWTHQLGLVILLANIHMPWNFINKENWPCFFHFGSKYNLLYKHVCIFKRCCNETESNWSQSYSYKHVNKQLSWCIVIQHQSQAKNKSHKHGDKSPKPIKKVAEFLKGTWGNRNIFSFTEDRGKTGTRTTPCSPRACPGRTL